MSVGSGNSGEGGAVVVNAGQTDDTLGATGGYVSIKSGFSSETSSGPFYLATANSGFRGVSGEIAMSTGVSANGNSGTVTVGTGQASSGRGGDFRVRVGTGDSGGGGDVLLFAGETTAAAAVRIILN